MKTPFLSFLYLLIFGISSTLSTAVTAQQQSEPMEKPRESASEETAVQWLQDWYDKIRESGGKVSQDVWNWVNDDWKKLGAWEYKVVTWNLKEEPSLETKLNELGQQRWECFWVGNSGNDLQMFFKRPKYSLLRSVPANDLFRLIPQGKGEAAE